MDTVYLKIRGSQYNDSYDFSQRDELLKDYFIKGKVTQYSVDATINLPLQFILFGGHTLQKAYFYPNAHKQEVGLGKKFDGPWIDYTDVIYGTVKSYGGKHRFVENNIKKSILNKKVELCSALRIDKYQKFLNPETTAKSIELSTKGFINNHINVQLLLALGSNNDYIYDFYSMLMASYYYY